MTEAFHGSGYLKYRTMKLPLTLLLNCASSGICRRLERGTTSTRQVITPFK